MSKVKPKRVCVLGSSDWATTIAKLIGNNAKKHETIHETVIMYVPEEIVDGKKLTEIINKTHVNVKYLPGHKLSSNVVAVPDVVEAAKDADILVFVVSHMLIHTLCDKLYGKIKPTAVGLSLIKAFDKVQPGGIELISHVIQKQLKIQVGVLMGANLAGEVADGKFCETTIGFKDKRFVPIFRDMIETDNFRICIIDDVDTVEVCGVLKNVVAVGVGIVDGLSLSENTKAVVIRLGFMEMVKFVDVFYPGSKFSTFFESCGVADLVTTCYGGNQRHVAAAFVKENRPLGEVEKEMLNGRRLQGPVTAETVYDMLKERKLEESFPLMTAIHKICINQLKPSQLIDCIRDHPGHLRTVRNTV